MCTANNSVCWMMIWRVSEWNHHPTLCREESTLAWCILCLCLMLERLLRCALRRSVSWQLNEQQEVWVLEGLYPSIKQQADQMILWQGHCIGWLVRKFGASNMVTMSWGSTQFLWREPNQCTQPGMANRSSLSALTDQSIRNFCRDQLLGTCGLLGKTLMGWANRTAVWRKCRRSPKNLKSYGRWLVLAPVAGASVTWWWKGWGSKDIMKDSDSCASWNRAHGECKNISNLAWSQSMRCKLIRSMGTTRCSSRLSSVACKQLSLHMLKRLVIVNLGPLVANFHWKNSRRLGGLQDKQGHWWCVRNC